VTKTNRKPGSFTTTMILNCGKLWAENHYYIRCDYWMASSSGCITSWRSTDLRQ
jgi:hypothetical protein